MAVAEQENVPKTYEAALRLAWIAKGIAEADVYYNGFQINDDEDADGGEGGNRTFPQIQFGCSVDVPDGIEFDQESKTRAIDASSALIFHTADDPQRAALAIMLGKFRAMFATANADRDAWAAAYLPTGYSIDALLIIPSPPPFFDDNWAIFETNFTIQFTVP